MEDLRYREFDKDPIDKGHRHYGLFQKRRSFEHEKELRATILLDEAHYGEGAYVRCNLGILINNIHVSPFVGNYVRDDIEKLCSGKIQIVNKPVRRSTLLNEPDYGIEIPVVSDGT